ncbi:small CPxCG-related zinc finger protein [Natronomonas moolapensis 8.8.11]|uniref:Small CPxCG-related zinc finger protein n=1 Tax=Natronomonas moolapensis (strain DSM 18674 / CECT 7526 / JCM 14361 / 8.8.11) TaxID=268739 RepID=M1XP86_NATM8|nr:small CPxCG-related zinc finger protein [Natronomonas moolapensis 8.8.11]
MNRIHQLKQILVPETQTTRLAECRHCGESVDAETEACPECGSNEIARYEF